MREGVIYLVEGAPSRPRPEELEGVGLPPVEWRQWLDLRTPPGCVEKTPRPGRGRSRSSVAHLALVTWRLGPGLGVGGCRPGGLGGGSSDGRGQRPAQVARWGTSRSRWSLQVSPTLK